MKVLVLCLSATAAMTSGNAPGVRVTGYSPVRLTFAAANDAAVRVRLPSRVQAVP